MAIRDYDSSGIARVWRFQDTDALGSVIRQTDKYGNDFPDTAVVYDAWGGQHGVIPQDGPGYTGHVEDADTNLVYMQQRYYDPSVGRFLSMDPVDASGTDGSNLDRYWYASDNPYRYTDPDGEASAGELASPCRPGPYCGRGAGAQGLLTFTGNVEDVDNKEGLDGGMGSGASGGNQAPPQSQSTHSDAASDSTQPQRFVIQGAKNHGSYQDYSYQLLDAQGSPITGSGYSAEEHEVPASLVRNSNNVFGGLDHGVFQDNVGWLSPVGPNYSYSVKITFQTFSVTDKNGRLFNLSTEFMYVNAYYPLSPYNIYINYVIPIKP